MILNAGSAQVVLLTNVASYWGFATQYSDFNALKVASKYRSDWFYKKDVQIHISFIFCQEVHQDEMEILGVPCGQFFNVRDLARSETLDFDI